MNITYELQMNNIDLFVCTVEQINKRFNKLTIDPLEVHVNDKVTCIWLVQYICIYVNINANKKKINKCITKMYHNIIMLLMPFYSSLETEDALHKVLYKWLLIRHNMYRMWSSIPKQTLFRRVQLFTRRQHSSYKSKNDRSLNIIPFTCF